MIVTILILIIVFATMILFAKTLQMKQFEQENRMMQSYMDVMQEFYDAIQQKTEITRKYRHDIAKHIQTLEMLVKKHSNSAILQEYVEGMKEKYEKVKQEMFCYDEIINSVCAIKKEQCDEKKIPLTICIENERYTEIEEVDMVGLLQNLLDNAIEANERIADTQKKGIQFEMKKEAGQIKIIVANQISENKNLDFNTEKEDKDAHGIGTQIIDGIVKKYHGTKQYEVDEKEHRVTAKILLSSR